MEQVKRIGALLILALMALPAARLHAQDNPFTTLEEFQTALDDAIRSGEIEPFWARVLAGPVPITFADGTAVFLYRGEANSVEWRGDFNAWESGPDAFGERQGDSDLWVLIRQFPTDARLDYKIVLNGSSWILDPLNPVQQVSGFGPNSVLAMPDYVFPTVVIPRDDIEHGTLSNDMTLASKSLGYTVNVRVYTPAGYRDLDDLPVIYVTDGHEYANPDEGSMIITLDNLIADGTIKPVIAVFIDPRQPGHPDNNRRADELVTNPAYGDFLAFELVPTIDAVYDTDPSPEARAILGTSLGGVNSAYIGLTYSDTFHLIAIQSPALQVATGLIDQYRDSALLPLTIFMSQGTVWDDVQNTRRLRDVLESKGYPLLFMEVSEGHSWGNWRALLDDMLTYFFAYGEG